MRKHGQSPAVGRALVAHEIVHPHLEAFVNNDRIQEEDPLEHRRQSGREKVRPGVAALTPEEQERAHEENAEEADRKDHPKEELRVRREGKRGQVTVWATELAVGCWWAMWPSSKGRPC